MRRRTRQPIFPVFRMGNILKNKRNIWNLNKKFVFHSCG